MAIKVVDNFSLTKQAPLDERIVATTVDEALANIDRLSRYEGLTVYIIEKKHITDLQGVSKMRTLSH